MRVSKAETNTEESPPPKLGYAPRRRCGYSLLDGKEVHQIGLPGLKRLVSEHTQGDETLRT